MVNIQEYIDNNFPKEERKNVKELNISKKNLEGELDLSDFTSLESLNCSYNQLTNLNMNNCQQLKIINFGFNKLTNLDLTNLKQLERIDCFDNYLTNFDYSSLNPNKLTYLNISANNLPKQDCSVFSSFTNLETLWIGNDNEEHHQKNIYNKFFGSLESLKSLVKLKSLYINNTDINDGIEYLPNTIEKIYCSSQERPESKVSKISEQLAPFNNSIKMWRRWKKEGLNEQELKQWTEAGLKENEWVLAIYLKQKKYDPVSDNLEELRKEFQQVQTWLDFNYPKEEDKTNCELLDIRSDTIKETLTGSLSLSGFTNLKKLWCSKQQLTNLDLTDCPQLEVLQCWDNQLTELNVSNCPQLKTLGCSGNKLINLDLSEHSNLTDLKCWNNQLSALDLTNCTQLTEIWCQQNKLEQLTLPPKLDNLQKLVCWNNLLTDLNFSALNSEKVITLSLTNNNFSTRDLNCFTRLTELKELHVGTINESDIYNRFIGSLEHLKNLTKLEKLNISNTDINEGIEYLPNSLKEICYSSKERPESKVKILEEQLVPFNNSIKIWRRWKEVGLTEQEFEQWKQVGLEDNEQVFAIYLKQKGHNPTNGNLEELRKEFQQTQTWLDSNYPDREARKETETLDLSKQNLEGELDLSDFINLKKLILKGNNFTGSLEFLKHMTKLEELYLEDFNHFCCIRVGNNFTFDLKYLPSSLRKVECDIEREEAEKIEKELSIYNHNLVLWQANHPELMEQAVDLNNISYEEAELKTAIGLPSYLNKECLIWDKTKNLLNLLINKGKINFNYPNFILRDPHPFLWETKTSSPFSELPLRLYNLEDKKVEESKDRKDITNYMALSYMWGTEWEKQPKNYGASYETDLTKLGRKALNKVIATYPHTGIKYIWIDNFCINQDDKEEKGQEVRKQKQYYRNAVATLIAINGSLGEVDLDDKVELTTHIIKQIFISPWFKRSWTFQEGLLSKQTIFMFDDALVDGRNLALAWGGLQEKKVDAFYFPCLGSASEFELNTDPQIFITPLGWSYGAKLDQNVNLNLGQALSAVKHRQQTVPIDGIYSILGLLPYGDKVVPKYEPNFCSRCPEQKEAKDCQHEEKDKKYHVYIKEELERVLLEVTEVAMEQGHKEEWLSWIGSRNKNNWYIPQINENGLTNVERGLNDYEFDENMKITPQGIQTVGERYVVSEIISRYGLSSLVWNWFSQNMGSFQSLGSLNFVKVGGDLLILTGAKETLEQLKVGDSLVVIGEQKVMAQKLVILLSENNDYPIDLVEIDEIKSLTPQELFIDLVNKKTIFGTENITHYQQLVKELEELEPKTNEYIQKKQELDNLLEWNRWKGIHKDFTKELVQEWESKGFDYEEVCKWRSTFISEFSPLKIDFCLWLKNDKKVSAEKCGYNYFSFLEFMDLQEDKKEKLRKQLIEEYREQTEAQIQIPPKQQK